MLLLSLAWLIPGCGSDEQAQKHDQASEDFKLAHRHVEHAAAGFVADDRFDTSVTALNSYLSNQNTPAANSTLEMYQQRELVEAQKKLTQLLDAGTPAQQATVARSLAEAHTMLARMHVENAITAWAAQSTLTSHTLSTLAAAREAYTLATSLEKSDSADMLAKANRDLAQAENSLRTQTQAIGELSRQRDELQTRRSTADQLRQAKANDAADRLKRSFEAEGQARFDLAQQSAQFSREAHAAATEVDSLDADIDILQAQIRIAQIQQAQIQTNVDSLKQTIETHNERRRQMGTDSLQAGAAADQNAQALAQSLAQRAAEHEKKIVDQFNKATEYLGQAIATLDQAQNKVQGDQRVGIKASLAAKQAELGLALYRATEVDRGYANTLKMIAGQTAGGIPAAPAGQIAQMAQAAAARLEQSIKAATESLQAAATSLKDAEDAASDKKTRQAMLSQLVVVLEALGQVTGDTSFADQASTARNALEQLKQE